MTLKWQGLQIAVSLTVPQERLDRVRHVGGISQREWAKPTLQCLHIASSPGKTPGEKDRTKAQMPEDGAHSNMSCVRGDQKGLLGDLRVRQTQKRWHSAGQTALTKGR